MLQVVEQGWPGVPRHFVGGNRNVVAAEGANRNELDIGQPVAVDCRLQIALDGFKNFLAVVDAVELVDHNGNSRNLHERTDVQVPKGLRSNAAGGINQHQADVCA